MDQATTAIVAPWAQLGVIGSVVLALGIVCVLLWRSLTEARKEHMAEIRACHVQSVDLLKQTIESNNKLADAIDGSTRATEATLAIVRRPA